MDRRPYHQHPPIAARAQTHPGVWVEVGPYNGRKSALVMANKIRTGQVLAYLGGAYEVEVRGVDQVEPVVWVMYVGVRAEEASEIQQRQEQQ